MPKSSAEQLLSIFQKFQQSSKLKTGVNYSMRQTSSELLATVKSVSVHYGSKPTLPDANALGRWTNPGEKLNWRIPLSKVSSVATALQATQSEIDDLMFSRLFELAESNPDHGGLTAGAWVYDYMHRKLELNSDEQFLLEAFRSVCQRTPYAIFSNADRSNLENCLEQFVKKNMCDINIVPGSDDEVTNDEHDEVKRRAQQAAKNNSSMEDAGDLKDKIPEKFTAKKFLNRLKKLSR